MPFWEMILTALALCVDTLVLSTTSSMRSRLSAGRALLLAGTFALFQGGFPLLGALLGEGFREVIASVDHWIAFALLAAVGVKMITDALKSGAEEDAARFDVSRYWVIVTLAVAGSIDAFVVGIGFGLAYSRAQTFAVCAVIGIVTFLTAIVGVILGRQRIPVSEKWSGIIAGCTLILLGVHTLWEHGVFG